MTITLQRIMTGDHGTLGKLHLGGDKRLWTMECPWKDNAPELSCIPRGTYTIRLHHSPSKGKCFRLDPDQVAPRTEILIHTGNWAGDSTMGYRTDSLGCILPGSRPAFDGDGQLMVASSRLAMNGLFDWLADEAETHLVIQGVCG